jgi:general secretion pathway protein F
MPRFTYAALDAAGRETSGTIEAESEADVADQLARRGLLPVRTQPVEAGSVTDAATPTAGNATSYALKPAELSTFTRQLATLLQAALPLDQALRLVSAQNKSGRLAAYASAVADDVAAGRSLADAMAARTAKLAPDIPALLRAGEARGDMNRSLLDIAGSLERRMAVRQRVLSALLYPAVLILVALVALGIVIGVLVPTLVPLFTEAGKTVPAALAVAQSIAGLFSAHGLLMAGLLAGSLTLGAMALRQERLRLARDRLLLRLPIVGSLIGEFQTAAAARTLGHLLGSGTPIVEAVRLTSRVVSNRVYRDTLVRAADRVKEGSTLAAALDQDGVFSDMALRFIGIGEQASKLDGMLLHLADAVEAEGTRRMDAGLTLLSPALTLIVGFGIGALVLSVLQALLSVNELFVR